MLKTNIYGLTGMSHLFKRTLQMFVFNLSSINRITVSVLQPLYVMLSRMFGISIFPAIKTLIPMNRDRGRH